MKQLLYRIQPTLYAQLSPDRLTIKNLKSQLVTDDSPQIAYRPPENWPPTHSGNPQLPLLPSDAVLAVGDSALQYTDDPTVVVANPFRHPRSIVSDFDLGRRVLTHRFHEAFNSWITVSPWIVLHLPPDPEGGYTAIELRALQEMALESGAAEVVLWQGETLTDEALKTRQFPDTGRIL